MTAVQANVVHESSPQKRELLDHAPLGDITTSIHPFGDSIGYLFTHRGQMYRAIRAQHAGFYRRLFETGVLGRMMDRGVLVRSEIVDERLPGFDLVIRHARLPHTSYPTEWSISMMRDAALATLDVQLELMDHGATMEDAHPWNVVFNGTQPVLVDLTAITPATGATRWEGERTFRMEFLRPLTLMKKGRVGLAHLIANTDEANNWEIWQLWPYRFAETLAHVRAKFGFAVGTRRRVEAWRRSLLTPTAGGSGHADVATSTSRVVSQVSEWKAESVNVIGVGDAGLPVALADRGVRVVACTTDASLADSMYRTAALRGTCVLPVILDALAATSTFGAFARPQRSGAGTRLGCDAVLLPGPRAVPVSDEQWMNLDQQLEAASMYASRYLAVELAADAAPSAGRWAELRERHFSQSEWIVDSDNRSHWLTGRLRGQDAALVR